MQAFIECSTDFWHATARDMNGRSVSQYTSSIVSACLSRILFEIILLLDRWKSMFYDYFSFEQILLDKIGTFEAIVIIYICG